MDAKLVIGVLFFLIDFAVFLVGTLLALVGIGFLGSGTGEGAIKVVVTKVGEISGINGQLVVFLTGAVMILASLVRAECIPRSDSARTGSERCRPSLCAG